MKKRTLVCFLIFTLCVFYTSIPNTVLGQDTSLAQQVFEKYSETLQREDIQTNLPVALNAIGDPAFLTNPIVVSFGGLDGVLNLVLATPDIVTTPLVANQLPAGTDTQALATLLKDPDVKAMFSDPDVRTLLQDSEALEKFAQLVVPTPPVEEPTTPPVEEPTTPPVEEPTTPPVEEPTTPPVEEPTMPPVEEPTTPPVEEPTTPPVEEPTTPPVEEPTTLPPVEVPIAEPLPPIMPTSESLIGKSRLGGLALNGVAPKLIIEDMLRALQMATGLPQGVLPIDAEAAVNLVLNEVPKGFLPKNQIKQLLLSNRLSPFEQPEAKQLDYENFGNAITPNFADFAYLEGSSKHVTRDSLQLYVRVPAKVGGVRFSLSGGQPVEGTEITEETFQGNNIPYTFRLDESLAATNLPAWPGLNGQLFSSVNLWLSNSPREGYEYIPMTPSVRENGVVWEAEKGIHPGRSVFYFFEVVLAEPVAFKTLDREAIAAMDPNTATLADVLDPKHFHTITITKWAMPDPRNLQMQDRGIINRLITPDLGQAVQDIVQDILTSPQAIGVLAKALGGQVDVNEILSLVTPKHRMIIGNILLRNTEALWSQFETEFDPLLASVFTVPKVDPQSESLWFAEIPDIADGNYQVGAVVHDVDGEPLDQIQENITVDTSAPEADIQIMPGINAAGYPNSEGIYVAAAVDASAPATLDIMGIPKRADIGPGVGYLFYQQLGLDVDGNPESNWMPLLVESTMLTSDIWEAVQRAVAEGRLDRPADPILQTALNLPFDAVLGILNANMVQQFLNPPLKFLKRQIGIGGTLNAAQAQLIVDALGATVAILDHLVPVTFDPSDKVVMPALIGDYGIRAMGIDTLFNVGSYAAPTRLRVVVAEADAASVTAASIGDRNGDGVVGGSNAPYENGIIFANTTDGVMLTVTVDNRTEHPADIWVQYKDTNGMWQPIGEARKLNENEEVSTYEVSWDVTDFDALVAAGDTVMVRTVAMNALQQPHESEPFVIKLDAGVHPVDFEVIALVLDPESITKTNPDSGGPQGTVTISGYTPERTYPEIASFQLMVEGEMIGTVSAPPEVIDASELSELEGNVDFLNDLLHGAVSAAAGGAASAPISREYPDRLAKWAVAVDTTALEDTITKDSPAARDASKDENQHVVTASAMTDAGEKPAPDTVKSLLSVDNVDDVGPVGPTNIVAVTNVAEGVADQPVDANEDGSYTVGGIVDEMVPSPMDTLTIEPTADPKTYASVNLIQTDPAGTETLTEGEAGVLDITVDVSMLENGTYMFHALAVDEFGNVQDDDSETDGSRIAVHVLNFQLTDITDLAVTAVDGVDVAEPPAEPIPLRESVTVGFMVANGSLAADQLSASINGNPAMIESAEDPETAFSLMVSELSALPDGLYAPEGMVTQWNGSVSFPLASVNLDNTGPMVIIETPSEDDTVDSLPTVHATYDDGEGSGADGTGAEILPWATPVLPDGPIVELTRILPEQGDQSFMVEQDAIETDATTLVYIRNEQLPGGAYKVIVKVADVLGNEGMASREFAISGTLPAVAIQSPASGQTFEHGEPLISGEFSGAGTVEVTTFTINDVVAEPEMEGNRFSYTPENALADGNHTVVVAVADGDGNTAQTSVTFTVKMPKDTTPPIISAISPTGVVKLSAVDKDAYEDDAERGQILGISASVTDEQSDILGLKYRINDGQIKTVDRSKILGGSIWLPVDIGQYADDNTAERLYHVTLIASSHGGTTEHTWTFTLTIDNTAPAITSITPTGTIRGGLPTISASANDESGVDEMNIVLWDSDGKEVKGDTEDDGESDVEGITRIDFIPEKPLDEGTYMIEVRATDTLENSSTAKGTFTIDFDTAAPVITTSSPQQDARLILGAGDEAPTVSITYTDAETGINVDSVTLVIEGPLPELKATSSGTKITLNSKQKSASQVMYTLPVNPNANPDFWVGKYVVRLEVSDNAHMEGNVSEKSSRAREANTTVHEFSFFIESEKGAVFVSPPINAPNPFKEQTDITFGLARRSVVSIVVYDLTLRPVRVLMDNEMRDAGKNGIRWDGTSSSGEDLARGVYFCQIMVADGEDFEPEYAILKLALTR